MHVIGRHRSRQDVAVGRLVGHRGLKGGNRRSGDLGVRECPSHRADEVPGLLVGSPAIINQIARYLIKDPAAPADSVKILLGGAQKRVA